MTLTNLIHREGAAEFARRVGINRTTAVNLRSGARAPSLALLARIRRVYPELDIAATVDACAERARR